MREKMVVFAPMPRANERAAAMDNTGVARRDRNASRIS